MLSSAKKARIEWLQKGLVTGQEDGQYLLLQFGMRIRRVNVIATAVDKQVSDDGSACSVVLDDGTDTISARFFGETLSLSDPINVGDILVVIGQVHEAGGERSVLPDIVRALGNPNFELLRELELRAIESEHWGNKMLLDGMRKGLGGDRLEQEAVKAGISREFMSALLEYENSCHQQAVVVEEKIVDLRNSIMERINGLDSGDGVPYETVVSAMAGHDPSDVERALGELLNSGEIYEPVAGVYRRL